MKKILLIFSFGLMSTFVWAQDRIVTGKVSVSEDGSALPGVTVALKGSTNGTVTDANGSYSITVPSAGGALIFSFIGLRTEEVEIGDRTVVDVSLNLDVNQLSEVVVTGSGVATDRHKLGISVESITADKLPATPSASIDQALIGKVAGAQISSISGNPGDPVNILLRGVNSVQGGTKPLIMIDGIQMGATDLNSIDMSTIERTEIVQGAASASIYGAQGANGVIQLFTKKGQKGAPVINFSTSYSSNTFLNNGNVHKAELHPYLTDASNNVVASDGTILQINSYGALPTGLSYQYGGATRYAIQDIRNVADKPYNQNLKYYDHFKQVFQTGYTTNNSLSISGATDKTNYMLAISNNHTVSPVLKNGAVDRTNVTLNTGTELFKGFKLQSSTQLIYTKNDLHPGLGAAGYYYYGKGNSLGDIGGVYSFLNTSPFFDLSAKLSDGTYAGNPNANFVSVNSFANPYFRKEYTSSQDDKVNLIQNFSADYIVNKFLTLDARYGLDYRTESARWTYLNQTDNLNSQHYNATTRVGIFAQDKAGEIDQWTYQNTFQNFLANAFVRTDFKDDFGINLPIQTSTQIGFDYRKKNYKEYDSYGVGLSTLPPFIMTATASQHAALDYKEPFVTYGYLINQKVDFGDFGGITAGFRSDYSSAFGNGSKPFTFPHFDGHILPSTFWKNSPLADVLPYFKIRAATGKAGIQPGAFDRYPTLAQQNLGSAVTYSIPTTGYNPGLHVEVSKETEIGTDFTVNALKDSPWLQSISGAFTYWKRTSERVIYPVSVAISDGSPLVLNNAIGMASNGVQFSLNLPIYNGKGLKWDFTTNFGHQISKITSIAGGNDIILTSGAGSTSLVLTPGATIGQVYGYKRLTSLDFKRHDGTRYIDPADEGNYTIVNGGVVKKSDYQMQFTDETYPLMNPNPKFNAAFINTISYKGFVTLNFQFDWIHGSHLYNQTKEWMYRDGISGDFAKPVTIDGETGAYTAYWSSAYYNLWGSTRGAGNNATKDFFVEDASFLRLRNVSLAFDFARVFKIPATKKLQLVLTGRNIWTKTKYTGYDPEISSGGVNSAFDRGVDHSTLPNTKSYQVGLNIGF